MDCSATTGSTSWFWTWRGVHCLGGNESSARMRPSATIVVASCAHVVKLVLRRLVGGGSARGELSTSLLRLLDRRRIVN